MKIFRPYEEVEASILEGYRVNKVTTGINVEDTGMVIELEREIEGGIIGIDICYNPEEECEDFPFSISNEYIKHVFDKK